MKTFTESDRYLYPLTKDSLVIDAGSYQGNFAHHINEKYGCGVIALEPVREFWQKIMDRFGSDQKDIVVLNVGLASTARKEIFGLKGDMTGVAQIGAEVKTEVTLISPQDLLALPWCAGRTPDLLKLNIEGLEHEVLEAILDAGMERFFGALQIQPHSVVPNAASRWASIRNRLLMNFRITSEDPSLDQGWLLMERK